MTLEQLIEKCTSLVGLNPGHRRVIEEAIAEYVAPPQAPDPENARRVDRKIA